MSALKEKWQYAQSLLKTHFSEVEYSSLLANLEFVTLVSQGTKIILATPTEYHRSKIVTYLPKILSVCQNVYQSINSIEVEVDANILNQPATQFQSKEEGIQEPSKALISAEVHSALPKQESFKVEHRVFKDQFLNNLNSRYTFDNYLVCGYNQFLNGVAREIVNNPGLTHNPMFVYSPVGLGKTHISQAIGHAVLEENVSWRVKYIPAETFKQQFVAAIQKNKRQEFIDSFLDIDLLIMDDIQTLANAEGTQSIFFQIYNQMHHNNRQVIITSDKSPIELKGFTERLVSRFNSGIVVDILPPDIEDRIALLKFKLEKNRIILDSDMVEAIADSLDYSVREIDSVVNTIKAKLSINPHHKLELTDLNYLIKSSETMLLSVSDKLLLNGSMLSNVNENNNKLKTGVQKKQNLEKDLDLLDAKLLRQDIALSLLPEKRLKFSTTAEILLQEVCRIYGVKKEDVTGMTRTKNIAQARQLVMWILKKKTSLTLQQIGMFVGNRTHSTVIHAVDKIDQDVKKRKSNFKQQCNTLLAMCEG